MEEDEARKGAPVDRDLEGLAEDCFLGGLFGSVDLDRVLGELQEEQVRCLAQKAQEHDAELSDLRTQVEEWEVRRQQIVELLELRRREIESCRSDLAKLQQRGVGYRRARGVLLRALSRRRFTYPVRLTQHRVREQVELGTELAKAVAETEDLLFELDRKHHGIEQERRRLNEKEYERRSRELRRRRDQLEEQLVGLDAKLSSLQQVGITRKTSGFMIWAGYLSFPAFGWFAGEAIRAALSDTSSLLHDLVSLLARGVSATTDSLGQIWTLVGVALLPIVILLIWVCLIVFTDQLVGRFDLSWRRRKRGRSSSVFGRPKSNVDRSDYTQVLAKIPIIYAWWMVPVGLATLIAFSGAGEDYEQFAGLWARPGEVIFYTFLGSVLAVVVAAVVMLYCSRVVEPRFDAERLVTPRAWLFANFELVALASLSVLGIVVEGVLGSFRVMNLWLITSAPGVLLLLLLGGFITAYGLMFKGQFVTRKAVVEEIRLLDEEIGRYEGAPAVIVDDEEASTYRQRLRSLHSEIEERWRQVEYLDRPRLSMRAMWSTFGDELGSTTQVSYRSIDTLIEPELVDRIDETNLEAASVEGEIEVVGDELHRLEEEVSQQRREHRAVSEQVALAKQEMTDRARRQSQELFDLRRTYRGLIIRCETAYEMGIRLRDPEAPDLKIVSA